MSNELKFEYIKRNWDLRGGIIYSKRTGKPVSFSDKDDNGRRFQKATINDKRCTVRIHEAIYMLHHDRPIAEGKEIHHIDGDYENNAVDNLVELTRQQHKRIHQYQVNAPLRGIYLDSGTWCFRWLDDDGKHRRRSFQGINEAMTFRAEIEEPRRQELRALGLNCKKEYRGVTASQLRKISRTQNSRLFRTHI
ncbi:HNH endonuclease [Escherichia coli]|uniref:HNH endonuclease signature motif containing protein n=1 Tax=Escherichia coli TaxID=562 RepID=UPI001FB4E603|nr:HNH endonuclease signature motif containing protein [Escherichia coli]MCJ0990010.1 HNH endonuclease [Escherichia coli]